MLRLEINVLWTQRPESGHILMVAAAGLESSVSERMKEESESPVVRGSRIRLARDGGLVLQSLQG